MKIPVIIDCDPGTDDALAILLAISSERLEVKAVTTVAGNLSIQKTTGNALKVLSFINSDVKVARGAEGPLIKELETAAEWINGTSGLGKAVLPEANRGIYGKNAVETIYEEALLCGGRLHIIALGPLTNIALLIRSHPEVCGMISRITLMGGACFGGNATPCAEFNIYTDPEAAQIVFESGIPITMVGLDVTNKTPIYENEIRDMVSIPGRVSKFVGQLMDYMPEQGEAINSNGIIMFDVLAVAAVIDSEIITTKKCYVQVETKGEFTAGKTVVDMKNHLKMPQNVDVGFESDRERFVNMLFGMLKSYGQSI